MVEAGPHEDADAYRFPVTAWGDYCGSTVERSNYRVLTEDYGEYVIEVLGGYNSQYIAVPASLETRNPDVWNELVEMARGLDNYPLINEEDHSLLEMEIAEEAWDAYMEWETKRDLESRLPDDMLDGVDPASLREHYYRLTHEQNYGPECEDATSAYFPFHESVCDELAELILRRVQSADEYHHLGLVTLDEPRSSDQGSLL